MRLPPLSGLRRLGLPVLLAGATLLSGCATRSELFLHRAHRTSYALTEAELGSAQFYLDQDVLLKGRSAGTPPSLLVKEGTPGLLSASGPHWVRIRFTEAGVGVPFVASQPAPGDSVYLLGTEPAGSAAPVRVKDTGSPELRVGDQVYEIVYGREARLRIDSGDLRDLIERRVLVEGLRKD